MPNQDFLIDGLSGNDIVVIADSAGDDQAELRPGSVVVEGSVWFVDRKTL